MSPAGIDTWSGVIRRLVAGDEEMESSVVIDTGVVRTFDAASKACRMIVDVPDGTVTLQEKLWSVRVAGESSQVNCRETGEQIDRGAAVRLRA